MKPQSERCPTCGKPGYKPPPRGRPNKLDPEQVAKLKKTMTITEIAEKLGVTRPTVYAALKNNLE